MKRVQYEIEILDENRCAGGSRCERGCPTRAITMVGVRKTALAAGAHVDGDGVLGWIVADGDDLVGALERSRRQADDVSARPARRAKIFANGHEVVAGQVEGTNGRRSPRTPARRTTPATSGAHAPVAAGHLGRREPVTYRFPGDGWFDAVARLLEDDGEPELPEKLRDLLVDVLVTDEETGDAGEATYRGCCFRRGPTPDAPPTPTTTRTAAYEAVLGKDMALEVRPPATRQAKVTGDRTRLMGLRAVRPSPSQAAFGGKVKEMAPL